VSPVLILACGNPSRGDDALGPLLVERLAALGCEADLLADFQLQIEHCLDLERRDLVVFVDASVSGPEPFALTPVSADASVSITTHAMTPGALLRVYGQALGGEPPESWLLAIRGYGIDLGAGLTGRAAANLDAACAHLSDWLGRRAREPRSARLPSVD
jgi:hydrogenase maturation protease